MTDSLTAQPVKQWNVTVYKSGNSKVITIPPQSRLKIGDTLTLKETHQQFMLSKKTNIEQKRQADLKKIQKLTGNLPGLTKGLEDIDKLEEFLERVYE